MSDTNRVAELEQELAAVKTELALVKKLAEDTASNLAQVLETLAEELEVEDEPVDPVADQSRRWMERMRAREQSRQKPKPEAIR